MVSRLTVLLAGLSFLTACSFEASIVDLDQPSIQVPDALGFSNAAVISRQKDWTLESQYSFQGSAGSWTQGIVDETEDGFVVLTSTQGALFTDEHIQAVHRSIQMNRFKLQNK